MSYIIFPEGFHCQTKLNLTEKQNAAVSDYLFAMKGMQEAEANLHSLLPENVSTQIFGNWQTLRIWID